MADTSHATERGSSGTLNVRVKQAQLWLSNDTPHRVGYLVLDAELMTTAQFPPAGSAARTLEPGTVASVRFAEIEGYAEETTAAVVHWWPLPAHDDLPETDSFLRSIEVRLR